MGAYHSAEYAKSLFRPTRAKNSLECVLLINLHDNMSKMNAENTVTFQEILPTLCSLLRRGVLTPFIGSGMSMPTLQNWDGLLNSLIELLKISISDNEREEAFGDTVKKINGNTAAKYRLAERIAIRLNSLDVEKRAFYIRKSLIKDEYSNLPNQMKSLGKIFWPLVIQTNYDDLYLGALIRLNNKSPVRVCGRGRQDCHEVLRSIDQLSSNKLLWAVQGFIGCQYYLKPEELKQIGVFPEKYKELIGQAVLGHQQYVQATNAEPHFRRAFAEVYRRKSLFFLGSGLQEDYIVSLFSEVIHHHGLGKFPHFALLKRDTKIDPWFLQTRLGITVIWYDEHKQLPEFMDELDKAASLNSFNLYNSKYSVQTEVVYRISIPNYPDKPCNVRFIFCKMPIPSSEHDIKEASIVSVGRTIKNRPILGNFATGHIDSAIRNGLLSSDGGPCAWIPLDDGPSYVFKRTESDVPIYAVAARRKNSAHDGTDERDLGIIPDAVQATLGQIDSHGFERVLLGAVSSGPSSNLNPLHAFAQTLRGIKRFLQSPPQFVREINFYIVDIRIWGPLVASKIAIDELLCDDLLTFSVELWDEEKHLDTLRVLYKESPRVSELLQQVRLSEDDWNTYLSPPPNTKNINEAETEVSLDATLSSTMSLILRPKI